MKICYNIKEISERMYLKGHCIMNDYKRIIERVVAENIIWNNEKFFICNQQVVIREHSDSIVLYLDTTKMEMHQREGSVKRVREALSRVFNVADEASQGSFEVITLKQK